MKKVAGSILAGFSLLAEVVNEWMQHFFWTFANIAEGIGLMGGGSFETPAKYAKVLSFPYESMSIFVLTRVILWVFIAFGIILIGWGLWEDKSNQ